MVEYLLMICQNFWADAKFACLEQLPKCCKIRKQAEVCMSFHFYLSRRFMVSLQAAVPMVHWFCQMCLDIWHVLGIVVKEDVLLNNKGKRVSNKNLKEIDLTVVQELATEVFTPVLTKGLSTKKHCSQYADPKKVLSAESLCRALVPSPQPKCPKRTFMLPQKYHASVSNMLSKPLKCFIECEN